MPNLNIACPVRLVEHFDIPIDSTKWSCARNYINFPKQHARLNTGPHTPDRARAPFKSVNKALHPKTDWAKSLKATYGIYILSFDYPFKSFYVGIAASDGKKPEGILTRIRKHRIKITASHVGSMDPNNCPTNWGGVAHTKGWRHIAPKRYDHFKSQGQNDGLSDVRLAIGAVDDGDCLEKTLTEFESVIYHDHGGERQKIINWLWPISCPSPPYMITTKTRKFKGYQPGHIILPDNCFPS